MIQYIASDIDGTLLTGNDTSLNPELFDIILKLKQKGVRFIAASGRQYRSLRLLFEPIKDDISYIAENGSLCIHDGTVISRGLIERELGLRIIDAGRRYKICHPLVSCESCAYTDSKDPRYIDFVRGVLCNHLEIVDDLYEISEPFIKMAMCDFDGTGRLLPYLQNQFRSEITTATAGDCWVDFIAPNANKGIALSNLLNIFGIDPKNGFAFGDQYNDVPMLTLAGVSYAMTTAAPGVEKYADHTTDSVISILKKILSEQ